MERAACPAGGAERFKSKGHIHTGKQNHPCQTCGRSSVDRTMREALLYLLTSFWLGAAHAATPGHGKTIAAAYMVGARGKPIDAVILGIFVTLSHTSGITLVGVLASMGSAWLVAGQMEMYLALAVGVLIIALALWMLFVQR